MASVSVGAGAYTDVAGNNGMASNLLDISIDTSAPVLTIASNKMMLKAGETASLTFSFNEIPVGFTASDVVVHNGALSGFAVTTDPKVYTATFRPTADLQAGSADVRVAAGTYADVQGNLGAASVLTGLKFDKVAPTLIITDDTSGMASTGRVTYTFSFSEDVGASFTQSDITTSLGAFNSLTKLNATQYTAVLTLPDSGRGTAVVDVMTGSFQDVAGNFNVADTLANSQAYVNAFALWQTAESNARTGDINALNTYSAEFSNYRENTSADGVANQLIEGKRLSQYINQVTGTDVVSDAEFRAGFTISGKAAAGVQATLGFRLDNDRTDGVDGADARVLRIGANDVNGDGKTDVTASYENNTGNWSLVFAAQSAALKQATHNTWGSGVHQLVVDTDGSGGKSGEEASRLFLVADGTASSNDRGTVQKNFSVQDQITKELFVYYYGDPDGAGVGLWTALDQGDNASSADVVTTNRDADSLSYGDWDYYSSVGNAASTQATASNTALHFVTNISAQIWEFHMATISNRQSWNDAAALAADHKIFNSNTSRQGSLAEAIALYAANFGADSSVGNSVGAVQALSNLGSTNSFNMAESNVPAGWTGYMWTAAPTPSGHAEISLSYGELNNTSYVNSSYATAVL